MQKGSTKVLYITMSFCLTCLKNSLITIKSSLFSSYLLCKCHVCR